MHLKFSALAALAFLTGSNASLMCNVVCTGMKNDLIWGVGDERLDCSVTRSDGFKSYPSGTAKGDFPSVCNGDYCLTQRWSDCRYLDLSVNGKVYSGKGDCQTWSKSPQEGVTQNFKKSTVTLPCQY